MSSTGLVLFISLLLCIGVSIEDFKEKGFLLGTVKVLIMTILVYLIIKLDDFTYDMGNSVLNSIIGDSAIYAFIIGVIILVALLIWCVYCKYKSLDKDKQKVYLQRILKYTLVSVLLIVAVVFLLKIFVFK